MMIQLLQNKVKLFSLMPRANTVCKQFAKSQAVKTSLQKRVTA